MELEQGNSTVTWTFPFSIVEDLGSLSSKSLVKKDSCYMSRTHYNAVSGGIRKLKGHPASVSPYKALCEER